MKARYDLIVIGGGPGGYVAAIRGAQRGMNTALIEAGALGGTCLNRGCIPTKALMHASRLYREICDSEVYGILTERPAYDVEKLHARKDAVVSELRGGVALLLEANGVAVYQGRATLQGAGKVQVTGADALTLEGTSILLAVGAVPATPPIPGVEHAMTSDDLLDGAPRDYQSLLVIGGGVIGMEIASVYRNLGCEVTVIEAADRVLPTMDREISQNLSMILKKRGVIIQTGSTVEEITKTEAGVSLCVSHKKGRETLSAQGVLLAIGRTARVDGLLAPGLALETDRGIVVNERFETSLPGVYAIGDCIRGGIQLAHVASAQATNVVALLAGGELEMNLSVVPGCIYTDPEIASVGLTADEAKRKGLTVKTSKYVMSGNGKSIIEGQERGFVKLVFDGETEQLLGAQLMCGRATDLISELSTAIAAGLTAKELSAVIRPHPTFSEGVLESVEALFGTAVHVAPKRKPRSMEKGAEE